MEKRSAPTRFAANQCLAEAAPPQRRGAGE
jgi:hypothetical protein